MEAHRVEAIVQPNGRLVLEDLPFEEGEKVEVIVLETTEPGDDDNFLKGTLLKYEDPFEPAIPLEDFEVLR